VCTTHCVVSRADTHALEIPTRPRPFLVRFWRDCDNYFVVNTCPVFSS
jgi:hypothetical protein